MQGKVRWSIFVANYHMRGKCNCIIYPDGDVEQAFAGNLSLLKRICMEQNLDFNVEDNEKRLVEISKCVSVHYDDFICPEEGMNIIQRLTLEELFDSKIIRLENNSFLPRVTKNY